MGICVGIDLGTTFSAVARIDPQTGKPIIITNREGKSITPSVLSFESDGKILFGEEAKTRQAEGHTEVAAFFKRCMGMDAFSQKMRGKTYNATDYSKILLQKLKEEAELQCGEKIDAAVITVPAYFNHRERTATIEAGTKAGLKVLAIINEPTAAAFAYGIQDKGVEQTVLIYDLGGGTFDVTIARIHSDRIDIIGSDGDHALGGKDWDDCIARYLMEEFEERHGIDIGEDMGAVNDLLVKAEETKKKLTSMDKVQVAMKYGSIRDKIEITEEIFETISKSKMDVTKSVTERLMRAVGIQWKDIQGVILVGGSTRMRMVGKYVKEMSGKEPLRGVHPDEAVALGAAIWAGMKEAEDAVTAPKTATIRGKKSRAMQFIRGAKRMKDVTAHALGTIAIAKDGESYINNIIIRKNTTIPANETSGELELKCQDEMEVYVLQGESRRPLDNEVLHKYVIHGIQKPSKGWPILQITYSYDANGVVHVSAKQKGNSKNLSIRKEPVPEDMSWTEYSPKHNTSTLDIDVMLVVDISGSMYGEPLRKAQEAILSFLEEMEPVGAHIGLMPFATYVKCELGLTDDYKTIREKIQLLQNIGEDYGGGTSAQPFKLAYQEMARDKNRAKYIIVLTDGQWWNEEQAVQEAEYCHQHDIGVIALGFGAANNSFLERIASMKDWATLTDLSHLQTEFSKIARVIRG